MGMYSKLASAIYNDIHGGLKGMTNEWTLSIDQLEDDIANCRIRLIQDAIDSDIRVMSKYATSIRCISVDCKDIENCDCFDNDLPKKSMPHFEMPVPFMNGGDASIVYIGSIDMMERYPVFTNYEQMYALKYRRVKLRKPYVFLNMAPNGRGFLDGYIFNAPYVQSVTVVGAFKDARKYLETYCCEYDDNSDILNSQIAEIITKEKIAYYSQQLVSERKNVI